MISEILKLIAHHGCMGYYYKDNSDLIGFYGRDGHVVWYRKNGDNAPVRVERGTPEQRFNRLKDARYNRLKTGVEVIVR